MNKNITVSVDEQTHRKARVLAANLGLSLSALVRLCLRDIAAIPVETLGEMTDPELRKMVSRRSENLRSLLDGSKANGIGLDTIENPTRGKFYEQVMNERGLIR